ncbi:uncharacterized protein HMPREF1541_06713 [Cyphellophora europaea CBS 101466]|uniref:Domain of unknown function at the cortex 1 domain-containing protein n=1 Tax=Cyphellophora europaea (strain CBS 101466) TaxID=1220924 RepID=W2RQ69_CYPE1|nr:uncharacterized protein HMPREF1541_06713 [Cyphellophora europaea CBS 101466]ETN38676.1 hypothetical protein HMPREF1541_06713 [Cyphellophora europaea CBS 101466]
MVADDASSSSSSDYEDATDTQPVAAAESSTGEGHSQYRLMVTAGPSYDASTHHPVLVNSPDRQTIETDSMSLEYAVRIRNFTGLPSGSPETSAYFEHSLHKWDQYSISVAFVPKVDIPGGEVVFGNDFDRPISDRLPPGFNQALKFVTYWVDPGLTGDVYAEKPYLYGPALSSWNTLRIGPKVRDGKVPDAETFHETIIEEGADDESAEEARTKAGMPSGSAGRKKFYLTESNRDKFTFEKGRLYMADFFNPYLDFNDFSLKLPGFSLNVIKYVDSKTHELRYVLKNQKTGELYAAFMFTLLWGEEREREEAKEKGQTGTTKAEAPAPAAAKKKDDDIPEDDDDID